jgi:alpha-ketoglutarate-dependent taurine dioxygenase
VRAYLDVWVIVPWLTVAVSRRGVCFFREQECSQDNMMKLARRLGELTGRPKASNMCIHPVSEYTPELVNTPKTQVISADRQRKGGGINRRYEDVSRWANVAWHSDVSFEKVPSDYSMLKDNVLPPSGGDTHWVNCYDVSIGTVLPSLLLLHQDDLRCRCR